jgi:hypothetical protein
LLSQIHDRMLDLRLRKTRAACSKRPFLSP